jgi:DNA-binding NarL/FixJ family response regulator
MENLLIIDRQPLLRLGMRLLVASHLPTVNFFEANCRYTLPESYFKKNISMILLGFDPDREDVNKADVVRIQKQFPTTRLIVYAGCLSEDKIKSLLNLGIYAFLSKCAPVEQIIECLQKSEDTGF